MRFFRRRPTVAPEAATVRDLRGLLTAVSYDHATPGEVAELLWRDGYRRVDRPELLDVGPVQGDMLSRARVRLED